MRILFLTQIIPYPPDAGPKVKTWHVIRYLSEQGHRLTLASFMRQEEEPYVDTLRQVCEAVHTIPIQRSRPADLYYWLRSHITGRPFLIERDDVKEMRLLIRNLLESGCIDAIHADQLTMAQFALPYLSRGKHPESSGNAISSSGSPFYSRRSEEHPEPVLVFDAHNAVWTIVERMRQTAPWFLRPVAAIEAQRIKRYEGKVVKNFHHTLTVTENDRQALLQAVRTVPEAQSIGGGKISIVPIAVDTGSLQPVDRQPDSVNIITLGTLHYPPNADGIRWFAREIFPLVLKQVPEATLTIVGKNPPSDFLQLQDACEAITVTGYVPDLQPFIEKAALMVIPVRAGGGMRVRILEAFARAVPVVTTTVGLEGIDARPGEDVLLADLPGEFAQTVVNLLMDRQLQSYLARNGRKLAETRYDWQVVLKEMASIYPTDTIGPVGEKRLD